jgi:hypothetical protein
MDRSAIQQRRRAPGVQTENARKATLKPPNRDNTPYYSPRTQI